MISRHEPPPRGAPAVRRGAPPAPPRGDRARRRPSLPSLARRRRLIRAPRFTATITTTTRAAPRCGTDAPPAAQPVQQLGVPRLHQQAQRHLLHRRGRPGRQQLRLRLLQAGRRARRRAGGRGGGRGGGGLPSRGEVVQRQGEQGAEGGWEGEWEGVAGTNRAHARAGERDVRERKRQTHAQAKAQAQIGALAFHGHARVYVRATELEEGGREAELKEVGRGVWGRGGGRWRLRNLRAGERATHRASPRWSARQGRGGERRGGAEEEQGRRAEAAHALVRAGSGNGERSGRRGAGGRGGRLRAAARWTARARRRRPWPTTCASPPTRARGPPAAPTPRASTSPAPVCVRVCVCVCARALLQARRRSRPRLVRVMERETRRESERGGKGARERGRERGKGGERAKETGREG